MKNYSVTFKSLRAGTVYTVHIGGGTGAEVPLKGGAQPFTTQEDDDEDMFMPIRTQSGYLRIVDDGFAEDGETRFDWKDLQALTDTERPVWLTSVVNGTTVTHWQGFMQSQDFSGVLFGGTQEREFPVQNGLSSLASIMIDDTYHEPVFVAKLLLYLLGKLPSLNVYDYYFSVPTSENASSIYDFLRIRIDWQHYMNVDNYDVTGAAYNCLDAMSDICTFLGWSCRMSGTSIYFVSPDDTAGYAHLTASDMVQFASESWPSVVVSESTMRDVGSVSGSLVSFDNSDELIRGYNKATVNAKSSGVGDYDMKFAPKSVHEDLKALPGHNTIWGEGYITDPLTFFDATMLTGRAYHNSSFRYGERVRTDVTGYDYETEVHEYDLIYIKDNFQGSSQDAHVILQTKYAHRFPGVIRFKSNNLTHDGELKGGENRAMWVRIGMGMSYATALWCRPDIGTHSYDWVAEKTCFPVTIDEDNGYWIVQFMRDGQMAWMARSITVKRSQSSLTGYMWIEFLGADESSGIPAYEGVRDIFIANLDMECIEAHTSYSWSTQRVIRDDVVDSESYTQANNNRVQDSQDIDTVFASGELLSGGVSHLMDMNYNKLGELTYNQDISELPERHLARRISDYWAKAKRIIGCSVDTSSVADLDPLCTVDDDYYPLSISHEWRDDITSLTLIEL